LYLCSNRIHRRRRLSIRRPRCLRRGRLSEGYCADGRGLASFRRRGRPRQHRGLRAKYQRASAGHRHRSLDLRDLEAAIESAWILAQFPPLTAVGSAIIHDAADELFRCRSRASTSMRSAHLQQDRFNASPIAGPFAFASLFKTSGLLSGLSDGLESVGFPELPRVVVYFRGLHGIVLLFFSTTASGQACMEAAGFDTRQIAYFTSRSVWIAMVFLDGTAVTP